MTPYTVHTILNSTRTSSVLDCRRHEYSPSPLHPPYSRHEYPSPPAYTLPTTDTNTLLHPPIHCLLPTRIRSCTAYALPKSDTPTHCLYTPIHYLYTACHRDVYTYSLMQCIHTHTLPIAATNTLTRALPTHSLQHLKFIKFDSFYHNLARIKIVQDLPVVGANYPLDFIDRLAISLGQVRVHKDERAFE